MQGRILGTGEREAECYVTVIVCWGRLFWGDLVEGGKGVGELCVGELVLG